MKRIGKMLNALKDEIKEELETWKQSCCKMDDRQAKAAVGHLKTKIETETACLVITFLRSSYITKTHQFKVAVYENEPFVTPAAMEKWIDLTPLFKQLPKTIDKFASEIRSKFIHVHDHEIEEISRLYLAYLYQKSHFFFEPIFEKAPTDKRNIAVFFGEELGKIKQIGVVDL